MADKYTNGDAVDIIENEGLEYAVRHYTSGDTFEDVSTTYLWNLAGTAMDALVLHLKKQTGRDID